MLVSAICENPSNTQFENQDQDEKIVLLLRAHLVTLAPAVFLILILLPTPIVVFAATSKFGFNLSEFARPQLLTLAVATWYLFTAGFAFLRFLLWFFNVYLVTDERLVDFDFFGFLFKQVSETRISKIQDVTSRIYGPARTIFNFGDVIVQTAGEEREFDFEAVPNPDLVVRIISDETKKEESEIERKTDGVN